MPDSCRPRAVVDQLQKQCLLRLCLVTDQYPEVCDRCWNYESPLGLALKHREKAGLGSEFNRVFDVDLVRFTPRPT